MVPFIFVFLNCGGSYDSLFQKGMDLKRSGHYEKSLELFKKASQKKATPEVFKEIANCYIEFYYDYDMAESYLKKSLDLDPKYPNAIHNLGLINIKRYEETVYVHPNSKFLKAADELLAKNISTHPDFALSYAEYGMVLFYKNQYQPAINSINNSVSKGVNKSYANLLLGKIYFYGYKNYPEALNKFNMAYNEFSNDSYLLKMLGLTHKELKNYTQAKNFYKRYIKSLEDIGASESIIKKAVEEESSIPAG
jgi:tetratricopeptide (TPR) repeat protein